MNLWPVKLLTLVVLVAVWLPQGQSPRTASDYLQKAISDYQRAIEIKSNYAPPYNALAWLLATSSKQAVRNGKSALAYARKAAELTNRQDPAVLDTLAAAYAEAGNFREAIKWQRKALTFPEFDMSEGEGARKRLKLYTGRKPYREK